MLVSPGYEYAVEYALEYGLLRLQQSTRTRLGVQVMTVVLGAFQPSTRALRKCTS